MIDDSPEFESFDRNALLQKQLNKYFRKLMCDMRIPLYNKFQNYNYHDTLASFVFWCFTETHKREYSERQKNKKNHQEAGEELTGFDAMNRESQEFWNMTLLNQELFLEVDNPEFQQVINRLEKKDNSIKKLSEMRVLRSK